MASSDDEGDTFPDAVSDYYFKDGDDEPLSFSNLPVQWDESESLGTDVGPVFLSGTVDKGLGKTYQQVKAWKFDSLSSVPLISVLSKDNRWIKLQKPRKSYENLIRTILITVHSIGFCKTKPEASVKSLWDHLSKVFSLYDVRPSENDLIKHTDFIREAVKRDATLAKSKFLAAFLENPRKRKLSDEVVGTATKPSFIVDDTNGDLRDDDFIAKENEDSKSESDDEANHFDSVCAICDNGGKLLCCDGKCFRSFHKTRESEEAQESNCDSLCLSPEEVEETEKDGTLYYCENCRYNLHQCFACGELGSSDKSSNTEVFRCTETCGHFYHPKCVAKLLQKDNEADPQALEEKIAGGDPFTCPAHKCAICKQTENEKVEELQFAVCRRCPTSYHRKCIPRSIMFEDEGDDDSTVRAWDNLLPKSRALMYCMKHKINKELGTPARTLKVRNILRSKTGQPSETPNNKKKAAVSEFASKKKPVLHQLKGVQKFSAINLKGSVKKRAATSSVPVPSKKKKVADTSNSSLRRSVPAKVKKPSLNDGQPSLGIRLYEYQKGLSNNIEEDATPATDSKQNMIDNSLQTEVLPPIDEDSKQRILALMKDAASSITLDEVKKYHIGKVPSTHTNSSGVDKSIILARVEGSVEAIHVALKKLEEGCSVEDAMAVCDPGVLDQIMKWKEKLRVYLAPFLHGMRYTSFGRHFTKVDKLEKIVDKLKWYVEDGDMVVDFCCGANDFSCLMKNRLDEMGKKRCTYKNFDITRPKNDFNYEKRDWMTVAKTDLPVKGSRLIMGLNPPFGKNATLANQFIAHALLFKPKLVILIVPPETQRLDSEKKRNPYDLIWEDVELLAGKSFYLPGSVDVNDKQMEQWNNTPPPLYLWSRQDWTTKHKNIAQRQGHIPNVQRPPQSNEKMPESGLATVNNEISKDLTTTLDAPIINEVEDLEKMTDKAKPDTKKRKKGSVAHDNGGLETKDMPIKEKSKDLATTLDAPIINEVKDLEKMTDKAKPDTKRRKKGSVSHDNGGLETKNMPIKEKSVQNSSKKNSRNQESKIEKRDDNHSREVEAQKPDEKRAPSCEVKDQKLDETRAQPREIEPQKLDKNRAPSREDQTQKHEKNQDPSREDQAQKHDKTRAPSRDIQSQKPDNKHSRAPSRDNEAQKAPVHKDEVSETQDSDFSFVDDVRRDLLDQNLDKKYNSAIDESTFSFQNDIGVPFDPHMDRRYNPTNDDSYVSSAYRRPDTASLVNTYLPRHDHGQYSSGYDRVGRGPYFDDMGSRGSSYSVNHNEQGLARYGLDTTPYNRNSSSTMQRYAPKLDELNHTRPNSLGQPGPSAMQRYEPRLDEMNHPRMNEMDHMNHMNHARMNSLGQPEHIMGSRSVGGYGPPPGFLISGSPPGFRSDSMGFATGPYHPFPQQHNSSGGWLNE